MYNILPLITSLLIFPVYLVSCGKSNPTPTPDTPDSNYDVRFVVHQFPDKPGSPQIYLAGTMNQWQPGNQDFMLTEKEGDYRIGLKNMAGGDHEFKFTRGSWDKVECRKDGADIPNRKITIFSDTTLYFSIVGWKDQVEPVSQKSTRSENVWIVDSSFAIPQLGRTRRIWIYLPTGYKTSDKEYPVLYMQDGQNLFDAATSFAGEWGIDEILDQFYRENKPQTIVVGIDNGGSHRMTEYNPYDHAKFGSGEGEKYAAFLTDTLKPFIDRHYRTIEDTEHTAIAGSSMGGLISFYTWLKYPDIFGKAGIFSPSFWIAPRLKSDIRLTEAHKNATLFFMAGGKEGSDITDGMEVIYNDLIQKGMPPDHVKLEIYPPGEHNEAYWHEQFPQVYLWLFGS